eukprot:TRINITY_DN4919_c0_g1_i1.p1 TRINITY_DN4919_c0_g1~~TRINITY_DN4919_c0_g1_i1.p1  ORF type:complete len:219 (-),score=58.65 TRINITY_DN4919_c0_g1_i1:93-701(-)
MAEQHKRPAGEAWRHHKRRKGTQAAVGDDEEGVITTTTLCISVVMYVPPEPQRQQNALLRAIAESIDDRVLMVVNARNRVVLANSVLEDAVGTGVYLNSWIRHFISTEHRERLTRNWDSLMQGTYCSEPVVTVPHNIDTLHGVRRFRTTIVLLPRRGPDGSVTVWGCVAMGRLNEVGSPDTEPDIDRVQELANELQQLQFCT